MPTSLCPDCRLWFIARDKRSVYCRPCADLRKYQQKLESQKKHRDALVPLDISEAEIEARYQAALKAGRRQQRPETEFGWNAAWKYSEPWR